MILKAVAIILLLVAGGAASLSEEGVTEKQWVSGNEIHEEFGDDMHRVIGAALIVFGVFLAIDLSIDIYLWIVVYSFYRQLKGGNVDSAPPAYKI